MAPGGRAMTPVASPMKDGSIPSSYIGFSYVLISNLNTIPTINSLNAHNHLMRQLWLSSSFTSSFTSSDVETSTEKLNIFPKSHRY